MDVTKFNSLKMSADFRNLIMASGFLFGSFVFLVLPNMKVINLSAGVEGRSISKHLIVIYVT